jgi:outer membrane protein TolC
VIAYEKVVQTAYGEAESALTTLQADQSRLGLLDSAEKNARYAYDAAQKGYQAGLTDVTTLLDVERTWRAARSALTAARAQAMQDAVATFKALGGGWTPPPITTAAADKTR